MRHRLEPRTDKAGVVCGSAWQRTPRAGRLDAWAESSGQPSNGRLSSTWNACAALEEIAQRLHAIQADLLAIQGQIAQLERAGITKASAYWRKNKNGQPTMLYLNHSTRNGKRRREYIGVDLSKQALALARIERWEQHQRLLGESEWLIQAYNRQIELRDSLYGNIRDIQGTVVDLHSQTSSLSQQYIQDAVDGQGMRL
jgi:hypothetical protein